MTPVKADPNLSLWQIESALVELIAAREEVTDPEEIKQVDAALEQYVRQEIAKVDRIAGFIRHAGMMAEQAREESNRLAERARTWERRIERLKAMCQDVMEQAGVKRIEGAHNTLRIQGNGGLAPLVVTDESQAPEECCKYVGWVRADVWADLMRYWQAGLEHEPVFFAPGVDYSFSRTPDNDMLRLRIRSDGGVPGAHLGERGKHLRVE